MKKILFAAALLFSAIFYSSAQVNPHAIGVRLGGGTYSGAEISYQHGLGSANRLEFDLGFNNGNHWNAVNLAGTYQWDWNITEGLNWFVGPGASLGWWSAKNEDGYFGLGIGGQIGLEYDFKSLGAPILVSLDTRPMWDLLGTNSGFNWGAALGIRYVW